MRDRIFRAAILLVLVAATALLVRTVVSGIGAQDREPYFDRVEPAVRPVAGLEVKLSLERPARPLGLSLPGDRVVFRAHLRRGLGPYRVRLRCTKRGAGPEAQHLIDASSELPARESDAFVAGFAALVPEAAEPGAYDCQLSVTDAASSTAGAGRLFHVYSRTDYEARVKEARRLAIRSLTITLGTGRGDLSRVTRGTTYRVRLGYAGGSGRVAATAKLVDGVGRVVAQTSLGAFRVARSRLDQVALADASWLVPAAPNVSAGFHTLTVELSDAAEISAINRRIEIE